jgi:hypothetical protein
MTELNSDIIKRIIHDRDSDIDQVNQSFIDELIKEISIKKISLQSVVKYLKESLCNGNLSIFLGSGISLEHGIPTWSSLLKNSLINALCNKENADKNLIASFSQIYSDVFFNNYLSSAKQIKLILKNQAFSKEFKEIIRSILYNNLTFNQHSNFYRSLANLCSGVRGQGNISSIITYNYDDLIETYLSKLEIKIPFKSYSSQPKYPLKSGELPIFHVHGFLPRNINKDSSASIILSEEDYFRLYNDPFHWANQTQYNALLNNVCLFIGLSMDDPNLRRLLELSEQHSRRKIKHICIIRDQPPEQIKEKIVKSLSNNKISDSIPENFTSEDNISRLTNLQKTLFIKEMNSLGCRILFISDFNEIPGIINQIPN